MLGGRAPFNARHRAGVWIPYLAGLAAVIGAIWYVTGYFPGGVIAVNDLRLNINREVIGDPYISMVSWRYGHDDFVYISFAHLFLIARMLGYDVMNVVIFFVVPAVAYSAIIAFLCAMPWRVSREQPIWLETALACAVVLSAGVLVRFIHWPILLGYAVLPVYLLVFRSFLRRGPALLRLLSLYMTLYLGASSPYMLVVYFVASTCLFVDFLWSSRSSKTHMRAYALRAALASVVGTLTQLHWLIPFVTGQGLLATPLEAPITLQLLNSVSSNSNLMSAISGANYFDNYVNSRFVSPLLLLFLVLLGTIITRGKPVAIKPLLYFGLIGVIAVGSRTLPAVFEALLTTPLHRISWVIKDPSVYAPLLSTALVVSLHQEICEPGSERWRARFASIVAMLVFASLAGYFLAFDRPEFRSQVSFFSIPRQYLNLRDSLSSGDGATYRNFWMPHAWYYRNKYNLVKHPATPAYWLTRNKELVDFFSPHKELVALIEGEVYREGCRRRNLIAWLLTTHRLQVVIDDSISDDSLISPPDITSKLRAAQTCLRSIPGVSLVFHDPPLSVYRARSATSSRLYEVAGTLDDLDRFLGTNTDNVVFVESTRARVRLISDRVAVLAEPYSRFWSLDGASPTHMVNFSQPAWAGSRTSSAFEYHNERTVRAVLSVQETAFLAAVVWLIAVLLGRLRSR